MTFLSAIGYIGSFLPALGETLIPVYVCSICVLLRIETVQRGKLAGIACAVTGALLVVAREESRKSSPERALQATRPHHLVVLVVRHMSEMWVARPSALSQGLILIVVHIIAAGSYWTLKKHLLYKAQPLHLSAFANMLSAILAFLVALWHGNLLSFATWCPTKLNMLALGFSTLESVFGTGLTAWAAKRTKATSVVASMTLQPIVSSFFSWILFGTRLQSDHALGMMMTTAGLFLVVWSQTCEEPSESIAADQKRSSTKLLP
jgi:drug/metabolite transporter (DMT)-like permease